MTGTRYPGRPPWDEAWFLEGTTSDGVGLWLRYTLTHGVDPHVGVWAAFDGPAHTGHRAVPLASARWGQAPWMATDDAELSATRARGTAGGLTWDLTLGARTPAPPLLPPWLDRLGVGRTYAPVASSVEVHGTLTVDGVARQVQARMVLGHLFGARSRLARWGWCHALGFDGAPDVIFQALTAELGTPARHLPALTTVHLATQGQVWALTSAVDLVRTRSTLGADTWSLTATTQGLHLRAEFKLGPADRVVLAQYRDPAGVASWCRNTTHGRLRVRLDDPRRGVRLDLRTERALGELAGRSRPSGVVVLPPG